MTQRPPQVWAGIDVGKGHHWITVVNADGDPLWNRKVINSETDILGVFGEVMDAADHVTWALDLVDGPAALLLETLANHGRGPGTSPGQSSQRSRRASAARASPT